MISTKSDVWFNSFLSSRQMIKIKQDGKLVHFGMILSRDQEPIKLERKSRIHQFFKTYFLGDSLVLGSCNFLVEITKWVILIF